MVQLNESKRDKSLNFLRTASLVFACSVFILFIVIASLLIGAMRNL